MADEIDDGLDFTFDPSEDEGISLGENVEVTEGGNGDDEGETGVTVGEKRRREDEDEEEKEEATSKKSKGKGNGKDKEKLKAKKKQKLEFDMAEKRKFAQEIPEIIAEKLAAKVKRQNPDLSALELGDLYLSRSLFEDTSSWDQQRSLANMAKFFNKYVDSLIPHGKKPARKFVVVLSPSALRACDVHRATRQLKKTKGIKLIKKNRLKDDLKTLETTRARVIAATPGRLQRVLDAEDSTLKAEEIAAVVCDCYLDSKLQNLWDAKESQQVIRRIADAKGGDLKVFLY